MRMRKKLYISCATLKSGGAERVISVLSGPFSEHFEKVKIFLWISAPIFYNIDTRVDIIDIEKKAKSKNILRKMIWFRSYIKKDAPDLLLSFLYPWSMKVIMSLMFTKIRVVVAERQDPRVVRGGWIIKSLRQLLYHRAKGILVQTNENRQYYGKRLYKRTHAIYNPVSMSEEWVGKALRTEKTNSIVTVGRLDPAKNHRLLIDAFDSFVKRHLDYKLYIYGEGSLRIEIDKLIVEKGLSDCVYLMGATKDIFAKILNSTAFVLSSNYEGMPNALIEAMCLGLPCISTRVSGATEIIKSGFNGILIENSVDQLVNALETIIDADYAAKLAENASYLYDKVRLDIICKQWIEYIENQI